MRVKNMSNGTVIIDDIVDTQSGLKGITLQSGVEILLYDEDTEKSSQLKAFLTSGVLANIGDEEPAEGAGDMDDKLIAWVKAGDVYIQFSPSTSGDNPYSGDVGTPVEIPIAVTNGVGTIDTFNSEATVEVTIDGGSTATDPVIQYRKTDGSWSVMGAGPVTIPFVNGVGRIKVNCTGAGDILLTLGGGNTSLDRTDTATVTMS